MAASSNSSLSGSSVSSGGKLPGGFDDMILKSRMNLDIGALVKEQPASPGSQYAVSRSLRTG